MPSYRAADTNQLHYETFGVGPPVVVLAGGAARHPDYLGDLAGLDRHYQLVIPHLRGVGESPEPADAEAGSFWRQADDVDALRAHLGLDRVVVVAHSAGTRLAMSYAVQYPNKLAGLLLITPPARNLVDVPSDADALVEARRGEPAFDAALAAHEAGPDLTDDERFTAWNQATGPMAYAVWTAVEREHCAAGRWYLAAALAFFSVPPPEDFLEQLRRVAAPTLVLAGAADCMTGVAPLRGLAELFSAGSFVALEGSGHYPWVERPVEFRQVASGFLESVSSA